MSRNTIGGATQAPALCVYGELDCTNQQAIRYDLNYFRLTPPSRAAVPLATTRAYSTDALDQFSLIIDRDSRILTTPPPGF
jgi:hypothetical protein